MDEQAEIRHHALASRTGAELGDPPGIPRLLDALRCQDGLIRAFFGSGSGPQPLPLPPPPGLPNRSNCARCPGP